MGPTLTHILRQRAQGQCMPSVCCYLRIFRLRKPSVLFAFLVIVEMCDCHFVIRYDDAKLRVGSYIFQSFIL